MKGRGVMASICCNKIIGNGKLNPITYTKLYTSITLPSAFFGCKLWCNLNVTEKAMIERLKRFCGKLI